MAIVGVLYLLFEKAILSPSRDRNWKGASLEGPSKAIIGAQVGLILLAIIITRSSVASLQAKQGLPLGNQVVGWIVLSKSTGIRLFLTLIAPAVLSLSVPFLHGFYPNNHYLHRLVIIFLTFSPVFIILTISYEGLFYFAFCATLVTWVRMEHHIYTYLGSSSHVSPVISPIRPKRLSIAASDISKQLKSSNETTNTQVDDQSPPPYRSLTLSDARVSLFFLYLLQSAFFSTGNIASVSSFSLESVYRLIPVFNPFSQGLLLTLKLMIPFAVISANLGILNRRLGVAPSSLFMVVMAISDVLTMNFFWLVRDEGSWLDIGTSISHFVIASLLCVFVAGLEFVSEVFVSGVDTGSERKRPGNSMANQAYGTSAEAANGHVDAKINGAANGG